MLRTHSGIEGFTVGQRRGLGIAVGSPRYVVQIEPSSRTVTDRSARITGEVWAHRLAVQLARPRARGRPLPAWHNSGPPSSRACHCAAIRATAGPSGLPDPPDRPLHRDRLSLFIRMTWYSAVDGLMRRSTLPRIPPRSIIETVSLKDSALWTILEETNPRRGD